MTQAENAQAQGSGVEERLAVHGKVSYLEIPAREVDKSAAFYATVFGWKTEVRDANLGAFDAPGDLIGHFVTGRTISSEAGIAPYIYVEGVDAAVGRIKENGGEVVREPYPEGNLWVATFLDPAGNLLGVWQHGPR
jgi:uncharacterized protein